MEMATSFIQTLWTFKGVEHICQSPGHTAERLQTSLRNQGVEFESSRLVGSDNEVAARRNNNKESK
jgi:hypothetical protein